MGLRAPSKLTRDEMFSMLLRMQRELEVAEDSMSEMLREIRSAQEEAQRAANSKSLGEDERRKYAMVAYYLNKLGGRFNDLPAKLERLRIFSRDTKKDFKNRADEQWKRVQKFLSLTGDPYRDIVNGQRVQSIFDGWQDVDAQEEDLFNEERLYEALGKDDARTILAMHRRFHELLTLRKQIDYEDDHQTPKINPKDVMYRFRDSALFQKMRDLLSFSAAVLPKLQPDPEHADEHTAPQQKNLLRRLKDTLEDLDGSRKS